MCFLFQLNSFEPFRVERHPFVALLVYCGGTAKRYNDATLMITGYYKPNQC